MTEWSLMTTDGVGGSFYWRYCAEQDHIAAAVRDLFKAVQGDGDRLWSPQLKALTKREFKNKLVRATKGTLRVPHQVKGVRRGSEIRLGEIRWSGLTAVERRGGHERGLQLQARLYYAEPDGYGLVILGLHCHEKCTDGTDAEVKAWQDEEIDKALACFAEGAPRHWGVDLRGPGIVQPPLDI